MKTAVFALTIVSMIFLSACTATSSGPGDAFAKCLTENGAKMYGAFWCPHCTDQKEAFGSSWEHITYIECSKPDKTQTEFCTQAGIASYPTWEFADGNREVGKLEFSVLAEKTGCTFE